MQQDRRSLLDQSSHVLGRNAQPTGRLRSRRARRIFAYGFAVWILLYLSLVFSPTSSATLAFTSPTIGRLVEFVFFIGVPWLMVASAVWFEWPFVRDAVRGMHVSLLGLLTVLLFLISGFAWLLAPADP